MLLRACAGLTSGHEQLELMMAEHGASPTNMAIGPNCPQVGVQGRLPSHLFWPGMATSGCLMYLWGLFAIVSYIFLVSVTIVQGQRLRESVLRKKQCTTNQNMWFGKLPSLLGKSSYFSRGYSCLQYQVMSPHIYTG